MWQQLNVHAHKRRLLFALMATCLLMILLAYASLIPKFTKIELSSKEDTWSAGNWSAPQTTSADETYLIEHLPCLQARLRFSARLAAMRMIASANISETQ